uniref:Haloacid dehalogenase-like hydrolase family protein n=1 Tax=Kalanchoe fedtschenkoi TaxID=63787 RepID=A0A7N0ZRX7_KALFE
MKKHHCIVCARIPQLSCQSRLASLMARLVVLPLNSSSSSPLSTALFTQSSTPATTSSLNSSLFGSRLGVSRPVSSTKGDKLIKLRASARINSNVEAPTPTNIHEKKAPLKYSYIFCDMDGTLLNSKGVISARTAEALKEATARGIKVVMATGKSRTAAKRVLEEAGLTGRDGVFSDFSPGVFIQGLLVYGRNGQEIFRRNLDPSVCREACLYSLEHKVPLIAFCENSCLTLFDHPLVDHLHTVYHEPKVQIITSVDELLETAKIQKLLFMDTVEGVATSLRPYWSKAIGSRAGVVQAIPDILEIVPPGSSKGGGVRVLLDHLGVSENEVSDGRWLGSDILCGSNFHL